jgi:hypothetical protein
MNIKNESKDPAVYRKAVLCNNSFDASLEFVKNGIFSPDTAYELGVNLKKSYILSPDYNINDKINECLPFTVKGFRKFIKKLEKLDKKNHKLSDNIQDKLDNNSY